MSNSTKLAPNAIQYSCLEQNSNMVIEQQIIEDHSKSATTMNGNHLGKVVRSALLRAQAESRVVVGLSAAVKTLSLAPQDSLFCFLAPPGHGDSATHMHEVLLQAFCFENDIYIIKVDSTSKLSRLLGSPTAESCALVQKAWATDQQTEILTPAEDSLVDYCEAYWDAPKQPIIRLPEL